MVLSKKYDLLLRYPFLIFSLFLIAAYLPVLLPFFHIKNDLITQNLPTRFFISESLYSKTFPWWNPYINYGIPQYGDMNNGFWNPFLWLIAEVFGYNVLSITLEEMLYVLIGGWGVFKVVKQLSVRQDIAIICGLSFMSGGFISGHLQHFCWITGAAFFPYVLLFYLRVIQRPVLKNFAAGGLTGYLFLSATHPGLIIGAIYFFLFALLYLLFFDKKFFTGLSRLQVLKTSLMYGGFILFLSPIVWVSNIEVLRHITRGAIVTLSQSLLNPTTLSCYLSLLFPLAVHKGDFFHTDISMRNVSIGLFLLLGIYFYFKNRSIKKTIPLLFLLLFFILLASGGVFKTFAYYYLPLSGNVRLNGEFSYFVFFILIIIGGVGWTDFLKKNYNPLLLHSFLRYAAIFFIAAVIISVGYIVITKDSAFFTTSFSTAPLFIQGLSFWDLMLVSALLQLLFVLFWKKLLYKKSFLLLIAIYLIIITWACLPFTGLGQWPRSKVQAIINTMPKGIAKPYQRRISDNIYIDAKYDSVIGSAAFYSKQIGYPTPQAYPVLLNTTDSFYNRPDLVQFINRQSYLFLSSDTTTNALTINDPGKIQIEKYTPAFIKARIINEDALYLVLLQNNYPRWQVLVDGKPARHFTVFKTFIGVPLSSGEHEVVFRFDTQFLQIILGLNMVLIILSLFALFYKRLSNNSLTK